MSSGTNEYTLPLNNRNNCKKLCAISKAPNNFILGLYYIDLVDISEVQEIIKEKTD